MRATRRAVQPDESYPESPETRDCQSANMSEGPENNVDKSACKQTWLFP